MHDVRLLLGDPQSRFVCSATGDHPAGAAVDEVHVRERAGDGIKYEVTFLCINVTVCEGSDGPPSEFPSGPPASDSVTPQHRIPELAS